MARVIGKVLSATEIYFDSAYFTPTLSGGAVEGTAVLSTGEAGGTKFLREDGDGTSSWQTAGGHTQNTDTGTTGNTFTVDSDSTTGKIIVDVALGAADLSLTLTNETLTANNRTATFQNKTGTIALTSDIPPASNYISSAYGDIIGMGSTICEADRLIGYDSNTTDLPAYISIADFLKYLDAIYVKI
jgi:hypothetical protein